MGQQRTQKLKRIRTIQYQPKLQRILKSQKLLRFLRMPGKMSLQQIPI